MLRRVMSRVAMPPSSSPAALQYSRFATVTSLRPPEPVRVRLPEDDNAGGVLRSIVKWYKKEGEVVKAGEPICEVDASDVIYEFNSPVGGWLVRITAKEGSSDLKGGEVIAYMASSEDQITVVAYEAAREIAEKKVVEHGVEETAPAVAPAAPAAATVSDKIVQWLRKVGGNDELLEYAPKLKSEGFNTIEALKTLEEDDFESLGISKRGHRKMILAAVAALKTSA